MMTHSSLPIYGGRIGKKQLLSLGAGCEAVSVAAHELAHALGFYHTQSRQDRDSFITIDVYSIQITANKSIGTNVKMAEFTHPRNCNKCICPSGYGGDFCDQRPAGCGKILTATESYQTLNDSGPPGSKIEVVFVNYSEISLLDGCAYASVEIKTLADKRHTGYRFCSSDYFGATLISTHNIVPVITYSRVYVANTILEYRI
ncbi:Astacin (Peptidase M12A), partial [Parelaphostrongylus tenuis]